MEATLLPQWLGRGARLFGEADALRLVSRRERADLLSYREVEATSSRLSAAMAELGLEPGESVAIWLSNCPKWLAVHFAAARAGLTAIPLNTWYKQSELDYFIELSGARAIFVDSTFPGLDVAGAIRSLVEAPSCRSLRFLVDINPEPLRLEGIECLSLAELEAVGDDSAPRDIENDAMIAFSTSGTTSKPKMAVHRERSLVAHAQAVAERASMTPEDVVLGALPPCGAYGYVLLMASLASGARALQMEWFDLDHLVHVIESERVTVMAVTEPILRRMLDHPRASRETFASLRLVFSAGSTLRPVVDRAEQEFSFRVTNVYGSSEVLALAAFWPFDSNVETRSAAGGELVSKGMEVSVVDAAGRELPRGKVGELRFRGPVLTSGYLRNPAATAAAFSADGWFRSHDLGTADERTGCFRYVARMDDALRIKGFLVNPGEIEAKLQTHSSIAAAQVVGIPDGQGEETLVAFVIPKSGADVSSDELRQFCRADMASYKVPAAIGVLEQFPLTRSANGDKVVKRRLREMAEEMMLNV
jgi:fatty-acyl-CoA synthase